MSWLWPRRSIFATLLAFNLPLAFADTVIVNTVTDDNANNTLCSLREAVAYFNERIYEIEDTEGATETLAKYQGCKREGSASEQHVITLPKEDSPYLITAASGGEIVVKRDITINGGDDNDTERTQIVVSGGGHRAFKVDDPNTPFDTSWLTPPPPAGAPSLANGSDSGAADRYTSVLSPVVEGTGVTANHFVEVYVKPDGGAAVSKGWIQAAADGKWFLSLGALGEGLYEVHITTRALFGDPEGPAGPALRIQIFTEKIPVLLSLQDVEIQGCGAICASADGGIIWTNEGLSLSNVVLHGGRATARGGAVYAGQDGIVEINRSLLRDNQAPKGGGVYLVRNALRMSQSLVTGNSASSVPDGAVIQVESAAAGVAFDYSTVTNSTFSGNTVGLALSLRDDAIVNSSTIVANAGGIDFNGEAVRVFNTILAGNGTNDCAGTPSVTVTDAVMKNNLVVTGSGCPATNNNVISNATGGPEQLMAELVGGRCSGAFGLLCPLAKRGDDKLESHLPRVLVDYTTIAQSPLINKGGLNAQSGGIEQCPGDDQRGKTRNDTLCDIGAVQLQALTGAVRAGDAIRFNQAYTPTLDDYLSLLGDEELLPASECPTTSPTPAAGGSYRPDRPGCPWLEVLPERGVVTFNPDGTYTYVPNANFHGFDPFTIRVMTTVSRLNSQPINQSRVLSAQVIMEPASGINTDSLGGALGLGGLFMLMLGGWSVRRVRGVSL